MSLATRCTSCGTIFKVVQDQLKVSEGWVRCGRCNEVFNALDGLFDLERDPPPQRPASAPPRPPEPTAQASARSAPPAPQPASAERAAAPRAEASATRVAPAPVDETDVPATHEDDALDSRWLLRPSSDGRSASERRHKQSKQSDFADARFPKDVEFDLDDSDFNLDAEPPAPPPLAPRPMPEVKSSGKSRKSKEGGKDGGKKKSGSKAKGDGASTPSFIKQANRQAQWQHPAVRTTLASVALVLVGMLAAQAGIAFKDELAAQYPEVRPALAQLCIVAGCEIGPWRHIEDLAVDSVTLTRGGSPASDASDSPDAAYKLNVVLHNRATVAIATPHVELSLTDASGSLVSKRVLSPADFGFTLSELPPGGDTSLQARLVSTGNRFAGYTVELFYP